MAAIIYSLLTLSSLVYIGECLPLRTLNATPTIPLNEVATTGPSPLPAPTGSLKFIGLQLGTQNYTCNATTGTYKATGALARIFDVTGYLTNHPNQIDSPSQTYLDLYTSLECSNSPSNCLRTDDRCEDQANSKFDHPLPVLGEHYFTSTGTPTFDLYDAVGHPFLYASKKVDVPAPSSDDVDWLFLASNGSASNTIISSVYRLETAGGVAPSSCSGTGSVYVPYAAEYWYYG